MQEALQRPTVNYFCVRRSFPESQPVIDGFKSFRLIQTVMEASFKSTKSVVVPMFDMRKHQLEYLSVVQPKTYSDNRTSFSIVTC